MSNLENRAVLKSAEIGNNFQFLLSLTGQILPYAWVRFSYASLSTKLTKALVYAQQRNQRLDITRRAKSGIYLCAERYNCSGEKDKKSVSFNKQIFFYSRIGSPGTVREYIINSQGNITATSVFSHDRLTDQISSSASANTVNI